MKAITAWLRSVRKSESSFSPKSMLPAWFLNTPARAASFVVLPLMIKGAPFAMIYADKNSAGSIDLGEKELSLLRTLRNQAVMAFKQAS